MDNLDTIIEHFVDAIKATKEYREYQEEKEKVRQWPELKEQIDDFRRKHVKIQQITDENRLLEEMEKFENQYEKFREDKRVHDFLEKELAFCRMMQYVNNGIMEALDFE